MIPPENYWPPELLARAFPDKYGHLVAKGRPSQGATAAVSAAPTVRNRYTVEPITGGCAVIRPQFGAGMRFGERKP